MTPSCTDAVTKPPLATVRSARREDSDRLLVAVALGTIRLEANMPTRHMFRVYLAGPISRCNDAQMRRWRETVKAEYGSKMAFLDPVDRLVDPEASPYEFVEADLQHIIEADGLLVNMWRESIGAAMGVAHAHRHGRAIVVSDPNHLENKMLTFFADAVEETPLRGAKALWNLLRAERSWRVVKSGGRTEERFDRGKIMEAVRAACREAKRDDIVIPRLVLPRVIEQLRGSDRSVKKSVTTTDIDKAILDVLRRLGADAVHAEAVAGVLNAWRRRGKRPGARRSADTERDKRRYPARWSGFDLVRRQGPRDHLGQDCPAP